MRKRTTKKKLRRRRIWLRRRLRCLTLQQKGAPLCHRRSLPRLFDFNLNGLSNIASSSKKKSNEKLMKPTGISPRKLQSLINVSTISDLKNMAASNLDCIKRKLEMSHSEILKDIEASQSRLRKRYKTQACQQVMDEAEKEYKKISERIEDGQEAMTASYAEFIAET